jgi:hypothetical protein
LALGRKRTSGYSRRLASIASSAVACLCAPAAAEATTLYASPTSSDTTGSCTSSPCRLDRAIALAASYDYVELAPGDYNVSYPVTASHLIYVYGAAGGPVRLLGSAASPTLSMPWGGTLENVYVSSDVSGQYALSLEAVNADRVVAEAASGAHAVSLVGSANGTVLRNSVAYVRSGSGNAVNITGTGGGRTTTVLGVTAVSAGGSAIVASGNAPTTIRNTIARGVADIDASSSPAVSYSNYRAANVTGALSAGAGNQTASDPLFVNQAAGDFRPADGSPTIDAGAADAAAGTKDAAGAARTVGSSIDIGAHEKQAPPPPPADPPPGGGGPTGDPPAGDPPTGDPPTTDPPGDGSGSDQPTATALPPAAQPVLGSTVTLSETKGTPSIRLPGRDDFVPLTADSTVPVGSVVDATHGTVELTSVRNAAGATQTGTFWGGRFRVEQSRRDAMTELVLAGGDFSGCRSKRRSARRGKVAAAGKRSVRRLWGRDRGGRFRSRGRGGHATVRGTRWLTEDRCRGTYFKVAEGAIDVRDKRLRRTVTVKRGGSYLAAVAPKRR